VSGRRRPISPRLRPPMVVGAGSFTVIWSAAMVLAADPFSPDLFDVRSVSFTATLRIRAGAELSVDSGRARIVSSNDRGY